MVIASGAGWHFVLKRGYTATSLSVPSHQSRLDCVAHAVNDLGLQGLYLHDLCEHFPSLEQVTIGGVCTTGPATLLSRYYCGNCHEGFEMHVFFRALLSDIKVC